MTGIKKVPFGTRQRGIPQAPNMAITRCCVVRVMRVPGPTFELPVGRKWCPIFVMKRSVFGVLKRPGMQGDQEAIKRAKLQKIKVVEDEEDSQNDVDNHSRQNYNVEHF